MVSWWHGIPPPSPTRSVRPNSASVRPAAVPRSGKSSIQRVVFHKMSPAETLFLESTNKIVKDDVPHSSFVRFQVWDFPGQIDFFDSSYDTELIFSGCGALLFVIDAQVGGAGGRGLVAGAGGDGWLVPDARVVVWSEGDSGLSCGAMCFGPLFGVKLAYVCEITNYGMCFQKCMREIGHIDR